MDNPFSYAGYVTGPAFCNRQKEQKDLMRYARASQNVVLYSHRRTGKTSLIWKVMERLQKGRPPIPTIYVDLYGTLGEGDFVKAVFSGIARTESRLDRLLKLLAGFKIGVNMNPAGGIDLSFGVQPSEWPVYLERAMKLIGKISTRQRLMVVFDEFQEIEGYGQAGFQKRLRRAIQGHAAISYLFSGSKRHILTRMFSASDRAFFNLAKSYPLGRIEMKHYLAWAEKLFLKKKTVLSSDVTADIVNRCNYQPAYIQQFLFELWDHRRPGKNAVARIQADIVKKRGAEFETLWDSLTVNQKKTLRLVAEFEGRGLFQSAALQEAGFSSASQLSRALETLVKRELIHKNECYRIQDIMFETWIRSLG